MFQKLFRLKLIILVVLIAVLFPVLPSLGLFNAELWRQIILIGGASLLAGVLLISVALGQTATIKSNLVTLGLAAWSLATIASAVASPSPLKSLVAPVAWLPVALLIWYTLLTSLAAGHATVAKVTVITSAVVLSLVTIIVAFVAPWGLSISASTSVVIFLLIGLAVAVGEFVSCRGTACRALTTVAGIVVAAALILTAGSIINLPLIGGKIKMVSELSPTASWVVAAESIKYRPLFGAGPGNFVNSYASVRSDPAKTYFTAGSQVFDTLATTGLAGLAGLVVFLVCLLIEAWKNGAPAGKIISLGLVAASLLTIFNPMLLALVLILAVSTRQESGFSHALQVVSPAAKLIVGAVAVLFFITVYLTGRAGAADVYYLKSQNTKILQEVYDNARSAVSLNPYNDVYRRGYASSSLAIAKFLAENTKQLTDQDKTNITALLQTALSQSAVAVNQIDAANYLNWQTRAGVFEAVQGLLDQATASAVSSYNQAITLDPLNPALRVQLGNLFMTAKSYNQAAQFFSSAVNLKSDYIEARIGLANALEMLAAYGDAATELKAVQSLVKPDSQDFTTLQTKIEFLEKEATKSAK